MSLDGYAAASAERANIARQYFRAGLVDEMGIHVLTVLLGAGESGSTTSKASASCGMCGRSPRRGDHIKFVRA